MIACGKRSPTFAGEVVLMDGEEVGARVSSLGTPVKTTTLDELASEYGAPRVLKMDIEGSEGEALRGGKRTLGSLEAIMLEVHDEENWGSVVSSLADFDVSSLPAEDLGAVAIRALRRPLTVLRLEVADRFATTRRVMKSALPGESTSRFPFIAFASREAVASGQHV